MVRESLVLRSLAPFRAPDRAAPRSRDDTRTGAGGRNGRLTGIDGFVLKLLASLHHAGRVPRPVASPQAPSRPGVLAPGSGPAYRLSGIEAGGASPPAPPPTEPRPPRSLAHLTAPGRAPRSVAAGSGHGVPPRRSPCSLLGHRPGLPVLQAKTNNPLQLSPQKPGRSGSGQLWRENTPRLRYAQTPTGPYPSAHQPPETHL